MTIEYYIARMGSGFAIAKFEDGDVPSAVYFVRPERKYCSCPASRFCKHFGMIKDWQSAGESQEPIIQRS